MNKEEQKEGWLGKLPLSRVVIFLLLVGVASISGCATYDFERGAIEQSRSFDNSLMVNDFEREALETKRPGDTAQYQNGNLLYQVTLFATRFDARTGKQCRDYRVDVSAQGEQKADTKTACKYDGQWYVVSINGKSMIQAPSRGIYAPYYGNYAYGGVPGWARGYQYTNPMMGYGNGFSGNMRFNGYWR